MNSERKRLESFKGWPVSDKNPIHLAKDGFYYLGLINPDPYYIINGLLGDDRVQCNFCYGTLYKWKFMDSIREEHKRHFPYCPFINGQPTNNIPIENHIENQSEEYLIFRVKKSLIEKSILDKILFEVFNHDKSSDEGSDVPPTHRNTLSTARRTN